MTLHAIGNFNYSDNSAEFHLVGSLDAILLFDVFGVTAGCDELA